MSDTRHHNKNHFTPKYDSNEDRRGMKIKNRVKDYKENRHDDIDDDDCDQ